MTNHIFQDRDGGVAHTAASRILKEDKMTRDIVGIMCEEMVPGAVRVSVSKITGVTCEERKMLIGNERRRLMHWIDGARLRHRTSRYVAPLST